MITEANVQCMNHMNRIDREQGSLKAPATSKNHCLDFTDMPVSLIIIIVIIIIIIIII